MSLYPRLSRDFRRYKQIQEWGSLRTLLDAVFLNSGFQALLAHRLAHAMKKARIPFAPALLRRFSIAFCAIDILPQADIGGGCYIPHSPGIVIGGTSVIGEDCTLLQGVTLGEARFSETACPTVGNGVVLGAGATLLGDIHIGDGSFIAAGAVVLQDVPPGHTALGVPAVCRPLERDD